MNKHRLNTILTLERMGIARTDIDALLRASAVLSTWAEHACNGAIKRDELVRCSRCKKPFKDPSSHTGCCDGVDRNGVGCKGTAERYAGRPYWYNTNTGARLSPTADRETGALNRARKIAKGYGLDIYHQGDPRGCSLYLLRKGDVPPGKDADAYYSRGIAIVTG